MNLNQGPESEHSISLQGQLLLAAPALRDGCFSQAVILLLGQLESELLADTWFALKPSAQLISLELDNSLWKRLLTGISPYHALVSQAPQNPLLN